MPGAIQVTVLEFKGVSSSSKPSVKSLKVSMGKREFLTWDKGEFSFPIAKLSDNLVVALLDAAGDEIARSDIRAMHIIEKGLWDEVFSIDGFGHVHMKLQFVLSEEDRHRIRIMRESAVKKKLETNPNIANLMLSETSAETVNEIKQVSGSEKGSEAMYSDSATHRKEEETNLETAIPDITDGGRVAPLSPANEGVETESAQAHERRPDNTPEPQPLADLRLIPEEVDTSYKLSGSNTSYSVVPKQDGRMQESRRIKVPSNVKKMISAFESSQIQLQETGRMDSNQEAKLLKRTPSVQSQHNISRKESLPEDQEPKASVSVADGPKDLQAKKMPVLSERKGSVKSNVEELQKPPADLVAESASDAATSSGRQVVGDYEEAARTKALECYEEECASSQSSGTWIFPDTIRRLCVTTQGDEHFTNIAAQTCQGMKFSSEPQALGNVTSTTEHKMQKNRNEAADISETGHGYNPNDSSNGLMGKVIKLTAILGFGLLVLLTRQKEPRDSKSSYRKKKNAEEFNKLLYGESALGRANI